MNAKQVDILNIGLILLSLVIAFHIPFKLFLCVYAILGPLHYLTEINWLEGKHFFVQKRNWVWVPCLFAVLVLVPKVFFLPVFASWMEHDVLQAVITWLGQWSNSLIFFWLMMAIGLVVAKTWRAVWIISGIGVLMAILLHNDYTFIMIFGLLIPTLIHVYLFTLLFMFFGALKGKSRPGYFAVVLLTLVPVIIMFTPVNPDSYVFSQLIKDTFVNNEFHVTNTKIAHFLGLSDGKSFFFYSVMELKLQIFIAFAYTYHYLNWFSKTTVIGWHKQLTSARTMIILILWAASVGLYAYDYKIGILALLSLSMLHVFLEFPLNIISVRGIVESIAGRK